MEEDDEELSKYIRFIGFSWKVGRVTRVYLFTCTNYPV